MEIKDIVEQDIEFKMVCDCCGKIDGECDFQEHQDCVNLCDVCYEDHGWVYKSERVEDEFILFLNILYSTQDKYLKGVIKNSMVVEYNGN